MKYAAQAILMTNLVLMLAWVYQASKFTRLYNSRILNGSAPVHLASVLIGRHAAGQGIHWLLRRGYREHDLPSLTTAGDRLRQMTIMVGLFSFTIPVIAMLWFQGII